MNVVTLTTDWGTRDHYLAGFKGRLISNIPGVQLVDISHTIYPFDVLQASYILKNAYKHFPTGTVHYSGIKGRLSADAPAELLIVESEGHYFIGVDSGLFSLVLEEKPKKNYVVMGKGHFNTKEWSDTVIECIRNLTQQKMPLEFAEERESIKHSISPQPMIDNDSIRATVIFVDEFENLVLNVKEEQFKQVLQDRRFMIELRRVNQPIKSISSWYNAVDEGELLALFNRDGYMEIALNRSNASGLLGINLYDTVRIIFL